MEKKLKGKLKLVPVSHSSRRSSVGTAYAWTFKGTRCGSRAASLRPARMDAWRMHLVSVLLVQRTNKSEEANMAVHFAR